MGEDIEDNAPPCIDDQCNVEWRDGQILRAKIVDRRPLCNRKLKPEERLPNTAVEEMKAEEIEYYVHYMDHDR
jgi:hypothetical protein